MDSGNVATLAREEVILLASLIQFHSPFIDLLFVENNSSKEIQEHGDHLQYFNRLVCLSFPYAIRDICVNLDDYYGLILVNS